MTATHSSAPGPPFVRPRSPLGMPVFWITMGTLTVSRIAPYDVATWWLEIGPILFAVPIFLFTRRRFPLTSLCVVLLAIHAAILMGGGAYDFLGTQGDIWDTQSDMLHALIGAITAQLLLCRLHDGQLARLVGASEPRQ